MSPRQGGRRPRRQAKTTVLLVSEGHSEVAFLRHLKSIYTTRNCGAAVTIVNAHGKGPPNVIDHAVGRKRHQGGFDVVACPRRHPRPVRCGSFLTAPYT